jgi:hypothetical protein
MNVRGEKGYRRKPCLFCLSRLRPLSLSPLLLLFLSSFSFALTQQLTYFQGTEYELSVYKIFGVEKGKTVLIIGGIQGNEPGGYLAADLYVGMSLKKGNLIVVPRANFLSIIRDERGVNGDMNRKFADFFEQDHDNDIVGVLKKLIDESDYLLNLHDGVGFYSDTWESDLRNPTRYGQSIITDCEQYPAKKKNTILYLGDLARKVCAAVNAQIDIEDYHFRFNNHRTAESDTIHAEQRKSATYYALTHHEIPAFGIETSKNIDSYELRVKFQTMVINAFMKEFDIVPEHPKIYLDTPQLEYLVVTVNTANPLVVYNRQALHIQRGDFVEVSHIEANYDRGLSVDIVGVGNSNDYRKNLQIREPTEILVKKDKFDCGKVSLLLEEISSAPRKELVPSMEYLIMEVNTTARVVKRGEHIGVVSGDVLKITDVISTGSDRDAVKVNFKGFVGDVHNNTGEDRGYVIDTSKDLWMRYSKEGLGKAYPIVCTYRDEEIGEVWVDLMEPRLEHVVVRLNRGTKMCFTSQEIIEAGYNDEIEIVDVKTNINDNYGIRVDFRGYPDERGDDRGKSIVLNNSLLQKYSLDGKGYEYEIMVVRGNLLLGKVRVCISQNKKLK